MEIRGPEVHLLFLMISHNACNQTISDLEFLNMKERVKITEGVL